MNLSDASKFGSAGDASDCQQVGGSAKRDLLFDCDRPDAIEAARHVFFELFTNAAEIPAEVLLVLHPFEITDGDSAGIGEDIRQHGDFALAEDGISFGSDRTVGCFDDELRPDVVCVVCGQDIAQCGRDQDVSFQQQQLGI